MKSLTHILSDKSRGNSYFPYITEGKIKFFKSNLTLSNESTYAFIFFFFFFNFILFLNLANPTSKNLPWRFITVNMKQHTPMTAHCNMCACARLLSRSVVSDSLFPTPWSAAHQAPLSVGFSRQDYWSGLPFPLPGDLSDPGIEPMFPTLAGRFFITEPPGKSYI